MVTTTWLPNPGPCGMPYADRLRAWCTRRQIKLHERVLPCGYHHVWFYHCPGWRCDVEARDFEFACRLLWARVVARGFA